MHKRSTFPQRFLLYIAGVAILFTLLAARLFDVQLVHGQVYLKRAENNRFRSIVLDAPRGLIRDRYGDPLVWNTQTYFQEIQEDSIFGTRKPLTRDDALKVLASSNSASIVTDTQRLYRYPNSLAHVVGYVGSVTKEDLQRDATLQVSQQIGKAGLEYSHERELRGTPGEEVYEVNAVGQKQRLVEKTDPISGHDLQTTLDPYLSEIASQALGNQRGSVVITDAQTGQILVMTSKPAFDPNLLSQVLPDPDQEKARREQMSAMFTNPDKLFFNRAVSAAYPPGSIFKILNALTGLEDGLITLDTQVVDNGKLEVAGFEFGNWYYSQYGRVEGSINIIRALTRSNDIFFYKAAEWSGPDRLSVMSKNFGLGGKTGIDLPAETNGLVPDPAWKEQYRHEKWFLGDTYHEGIGQGDLLTSPIQMAQMTQAVANDGSLCKVSLTQSEQRQCRETGVKTENIDIVLKGMVGACSPGGTAFPFFPYNAKKILPDKSGHENIDNGAVACKTGTAEFGAPNERGVKKTHAWFTSIMMLPEFKVADQSGQSASSSASLNATASAKPSASFIDTASSTDLFKKWKEKVTQNGFPRKITITVMIESDDANPYKEGSADGGPVARKILDWMLQ